jgi:hypothetical protein
LGGAALLLLVAGLVTGEGFFVPWAIGALGSEWIVSLYLRTVMEVVTTAVIGAALLLVAELAYWSLEMRTPSRDEGRLVLRRAGAIALLVVASLGVGLVAASLSESPIAGSLALLAVGLGALVTALVIVAVLVWQPRSNRP